MTDLEHPAITSALYWGYPSRQKETAFETCENCGDDCYEGGVRFDNGTCYCRKCVYRCMEDDLSI